MRFIKDKVSFADFNESFRDLAIKRGAKVKRLSNGSCFAIFNGEAKSRLAIMSGVHGNERSGPLAIFKFLEEDRLKKDRALLLAPMINNLGWDKNVRAWGRYDLNRNFDVNKAPEFLLEVMRQMEKFEPNVFMDLHEDNFGDSYYLFRNENDESAFVSDLQFQLKTKHESWEYPSDWHGSSENYARAVGCKITTTLETPGHKRLFYRVNFHLKAIRWAYRKLRIYV